MACCQTSNLNDSRQASNVGSVPPGCLDDVADSAVAAAEKSLEEGDAWIAKVDVQLALERAEALAEMVDLGIVRLERILGTPLKRRVGPRHERVDAEIDGDVSAKTLAKRVDTAYQVDHGIKVLLCLRRKTKHEVELDEVPSLAKDGPQRFEDRFLCDVLVDDITEALAAGFDGKRQGAFARLFDLVCKIAGEILHAERRERNGHLVLFPVSTHEVDQSGQVAVVGAAQREQSNFFVTGVGDELLKLLLDGSQRPFTSGTVGNAGFAEAAASHASAEQLDDAPVMDESHDTGRSG